MVYKSRSDVFFSNMMVKVGCDWEPVQRNLGRCHILSRIGTRKSHDGD